METREPFKDDCFVKPGSSQGNSNSDQGQTIPRSEGERNLEEMEDLYRNSSEEMLLKCFMENSNGMPAPSMETFGFKNLSQNFRHENSEELFKSWLKTGEASGALLSLFTDFAPCPQIWVS